jgi:hypothetical protein
VGELERKARRVVVVGQKVLGERIEGARRPLAPWRTAFHSSSGSTPAFTPMVKHSASAVLHHVAREIVHQLGDRAAPTSPM